MRTLPMVIGWLALAALPSDADTVRTVGGKSYEGEAIFIGGTALEIRAAGGQSVRVPLTNVLSASFTPASAALAHFGPVSEGWSAQEVGDVGAGSGAGQSNTTFAIRVSGAGVGGRADAFHYVHHPLSGEGEIRARITAIAAADPLATAGVMVRETLGAHSRFAMIEATRDGTLKLQHRAESGAKVTSKSVGQMTLPGWLRLMRKEKLVTVHTSADGERWEQSGIVGLKMSESVFLGLAAASHTNAAFATALLDNVRLAMHGLRGEYFDDENFENLRFTRVDPALDFDWGLRSPDPRMAQDYFSARWTGEVQPRRTEYFTFYCDADDSAQLWVNGELVPHVAFNSGPSKKAVPLISGQRYNVKMEFKEGTGAAAVRLGWSSASQTKEIIATKHLFYSFEAKASAGAINRSPPTNSDFVARGVVLRSGSFLAGRVLSVEDGMIKLSMEGDKEVPVLRHHVARINFRRVAPGASAEAEAGRPGVVLNNGDFFEGDLRIEAGPSVKVSSILFGLRTFNLGSGEVAALVLAKTAVEPASYRLQTSDGSVFRARSVAGEPDAVVIDELSLGPFRVSRNALLALTRDPAIRMSARPGP